MHITRVFDRSIGRVGAIVVLAAITLGATWSLGPIRAVALAAVVALVVRAQGELAAVANAARRWREKADRSASTVSAEAGDLSSAVAIVGRTLDELTTRVAAAGAGGGPAGSSAQVAAAAARLEDLGDEVEQVRALVHALQGSVGQLRRSTSASPPA